MANVCAFFKIQSDNINSTTSPIKSPLINVKIRVKTLLDDLMKKSKTYKVNVIKYFKENVTSSP